MLEYKIKIEPNEEITVICAIEREIERKKKSLKKLPLKSLQDFKKEIRNLINFLLSLKNKQLIGGYGDEI